MSDYKHRLGLYLGRFQPLHIGHTSIIDQMLEECESVVIIIGSMQEHGTERNPLNWWFRVSLIEIVYSNVKDRIHIIPVSDRETYSDDSSWGEYLLKVCFNNNLYPDVIYEGDDSVNTYWYDGCNIPVIRVSRDKLPISGTDLRKAIKDDREYFALQYLPKQLHKYYGRLRKEIQNGTTD